MTELIEIFNISDSRTINALLTFAVFIILALAADLFIDKVLRKFTRFTKTELDNQILDIIHRPAFYTILLIGILTISLDLVTGKQLNFLAKGLTYTLLTMLWSVTSIRCGKIIIAHSVSVAPDSTGLKKDVVPLIENILLIVIIVGGCFLLLNIWNINITPFLASAGIMGIVVALAAKDTLGNFFGGISIFIDRPFKIGDYIVLDGQERGEIVAIGIRSTRLKTRDDIMVTVPNSIISNSKIINESAPEPQFRIRVPIGVAYGSDIDLVQQILLEIALANDNVIKSPEPRARFRQFGDSSLNFELLCWTREPALRGLTTHELNCAIYRKFAEKGVTIPFPQRDIHIHKT